MSAAELVAAMKPQTKDADLVHRALVALAEEAKAAAAAVELLATRIAELEAGQNFLASEMGRRLARIDAGERVAAHV